MKFAVYPPQAVSFMEVGSDGLSYIANLLPGSCTLTCGRGLGMRLGASSDQLCCATASHCGMASCSNLLTKEALVTALLFWVPHIYG